MIRLTKKAKGQIQDLWNTYKYLMLGSYIILWILSMVVVVVTAFERGNRLMQVFPLYVIIELQIYSFIGYIMFICMNWVYYAFEKIPK